MEYVSRYYVTSSTAITKWHGTFHKNVQVLTVIAKTCNVVKFLMWKLKSISYILTPAHNAHWHIGICILVRLKYTAIETLQKNKMKWNPNLWGTETHNVKFRNKSKYQTDIFTFLWLLSFQQKIQRQKLSTTSTQTHCPTYYVKERSLILVWCSGTVQCFQPSMQPCLHHTCITWHTMEGPDTCHMQKHLCTLHLSLA